MTDLLLSADRNGVRTLTMNNPRRLNGWTVEMMEALRAGFAAAASDAAVKVLILTGADPYYCAGVNLGGTLKLSHPRKLHAMIVEHNEALFNLFIDFPKPILIAANGPAIGASVTSGTLCDAIVASEKATFSTPFAKLGVAAEGCSSVLFEKLMGAQNAERMLGKAGWVPTGTEAAEAGLVTEVVPHEQLMERAQALAEQWIADGHTRSYRGGMTADEMRAVNARESVEVATSFLQKPFLDGQFKFLWSRKKRGPAMMFWTLKQTHPLWSKLL